MNKNKLLIPILFLIILTFNITALQYDINGFSKIQDFNETDYLNVNVNDRYQKIVYNNDYFAVNNRFYDRDTLDFVREVAKPVEFLTNNFYYSVNPQTSFTPVNLSKYYVNNGTKHSSIGMGATSGRSLSSFYANDLRIGNAPYGFFPLSVNIGTEPYLRIINISHGTENENISVYCSVELANNLRLYGYDETYIYGSTETTGGIGTFRVFDYECNQVESLTMNSTYGWYDLDNFVHNVYYNEDIQIFIGVLSEQFYNYEKIITFDTSGYVIDTFDLLNYNENITGDSEDLNKCAFDKNNNKYICIYYIYTEFFVSVFDITNNGQIIGIEKDFTKTAFNNETVDYRFDDDTRIWIDEDSSDVYIQLYKDGSSYPKEYSVFKADVSFIDEYTGLVCDSDNFYCANQDALCLPNNEFYQGVNSSNYLCEDVSILGGQNNYEVYCDIDALTYCAGGCINTIVTSIYGIEYETGVCASNPTCSNDCNVEGLTYSDTATSYKQCGFYDADVCLDWSQSIPCADGEYSINGFCEELETVGYTYYNLRSFSMTPELGSEVLVDANSNPPLIRYESNSIALTKGFEYNSLKTSFYILQNCDYKETNILTNNNIRFNSSSDTFSGFTAGITTLNLNIPIDSEVNVYGGDLVDKKIFEYKLVNNASHGVCLYNNASELLGCEYVALGSDQNVVFKIQSVKTNGVIRNSVHVQLSAVSNIYTGFKPQIETVTGTYSKIITNGTNYTLNSLNVFNGEQYTNAWQNTSAGYTQTYQNTCTYSSVGCYDVRGYYSDNLSESLWNYKTWRVCINKLDGETLSDSEGGNNLNLNDKEKLLLALAVSFAVLMTVVIIGLVQNDENTKKIMVFLGSFLCIASILVFVIIGWIPVWIIITAVLLASLIVGLFIYKSGSSEV